ncbi:hypothetical protein GCM10023189_39840 [Nibrella saemangeumensis]|uniref:Beta-lactamase-related domain-containing protein n=2 Tax=Nibrella saemangeumensis TaxID=1084526 RepID=A0ABP8NBC1_9BACT
MLLAANAPMFAQSDLTNRLDGLMQRYVDQRYFSGVVLLAKGDRVLYHKAFGLADRERQISIRPTTNFTIASVGKALTATVLMQLVKEGKVDLQRPVNDYLPEYHIPNGNNIKVYHLLSHTGNTGNYMLHPDYDTIRATAKSHHDLMPMVVARVSDKDTVGKQFRYSNSGFILLGRIVEKVTGKDFGTTLQNYIFSKAGMTNSYLVPKGFKAPEEAMPYELLTDKVYQAVAIRQDPAMGDGGLMANAVDLWRFGHWVQTTFPADLRQQMWSPRIAQRKDSDYGYGWAISQQHGKTQVSHDGGSAGASADLRLVPEDGYTVVVLINQHLNPKEVSRKMLDIVYTGETEMPKREFVRSVISDIDTKGFADVKSRFSEILKTGYEYKPGTGDYINLFNGLNDVKRHQQALELAEIAALENPTAAWPYEALGDAYFGLNDKEKAKAAFEQALKLDANNYWAKLMLAKMGRD